MMERVITMLTWESLLKEEREKPYWSALLERVAREREKAVVYPPSGLEFAALELTPPEHLKAVILGQDPYHGPGQAMGLSFSVPEGIKLPPSLRNIYTELQSDLQQAPPKNGDLRFWARQGVLLLNTVLTVEQGRANSHSAWGWEQFTDSVIAATNQLPQPIAFVLWGAQAQKKAALLSATAPRLILKAPHPSPLSAYRGFFGSRPFSAINTFLQGYQVPPIQWS